MVKIVKVHVSRPNYGYVELDITRILAVIPDSNALLFENVIWHLEEEEFDKVYKEWKRL